MHDILEHYGKVIVALAGILAAVLITALVVNVIQNKTTSAVSGIDYQEQIDDAVNGVNIVGNYVLSVGEITTLSETKGSNQTWTCSDTSVLEIVSGNDTPTINIKGVSVGKATITVTTTFSENGNDVTKTGSVTITVK